MGLGSSNSLGQAKGKSVAKIAKRYKEVKIAKDWTSFSSSTVESNGSNACAATMDQTYYHDGSSSAPTAGDKVYSKARANDRYFLADGHYKIDGGSGRFKAMPVTSGVVGSISDCR
tara:strand:+ start:311 stop:658 length:348 start_codon:yes stop_codon:yes gene_type:complete